MGSEEYKIRCTKRTQSVLEFSRSEKFHEDILIGSLSSIPRWVYARVIEGEEREDSYKRANRALEEFLESSREIINGQNQVVEHFLGGIEGEGDMRLSLYSALMRTALYLNEKNDLRNPGVCGVGGYFFYRNISGDVFSSVYAVI